MRIVGGRCRGLRLAAPEGDRVRPTSDRAREAVFNILVHRYGPAGFPLIGARVLDLCAGTGAMGLEAWSRGAAHVTFVERDPAVARALDRNLAAAKIGDAARLLRADATRLPRADVPCSLVFLDPPYAAGIAAAALAAAADAEWLARAALAVVETAADDTPDWPAGFVLDDRRTYGRAAVSFLRRGA